MYSHKKPKMIWLYISDMVAPTTTTAQNDDSNMNWWPPRRCMVYGMVYGCDRPVEFMHPLYVWPKAKQQKSQQRKKRKTAKGNGSGMSNRCQRNHGDRLLTSSICLCLGELHRPAPISFSIPISISVYLFFLNEFGELISKLT